MGGETSRFGNFPKIVKAESRYYWFMFLKQSEKVSYEKAST